MWVRRPCARDGKQRWAGRLQRRRRPLRLLLQRDVVRWSARSHAGEKLPARATRLAVGAEHRNSGRSVARAPRNRPARRGRAAARRQLRDLTTLHDVVRPGQHESKSDPATVTAASRRPAPPGGVERLPPGAWPGALPLSYGGESPVVAKRPRCGTALPVPVPVVVGATCAGLRVRASATVRTEPSRPAQGFYLAGATGSRRRHRCSGREAARRRSLRRVAAPAGRGAVVSDRDHANRRVRQIRSVEAAARSSAPDLHAYALGDA